MNTAKPNKPNAVILYASPKDNGLTAKLCNDFLNQFSFNIKMLRLYDCHVSPCIDCKACSTGSCPFNQKDDMNEILESIYRADIVLCATPIYFNGVPAPFKSVMDRCQQLYLNKDNKNRYVLSKRRLGILLTTAGSKDAGVTDAIYRIFKMFFNCFHIQFLEHISHIDTDHQPEFTINQDQIESIKHSLNELIKEV